MVDGEHVVNSPKDIEFVSTRPVLAMSDVSGSGLLHGVVRERSHIMIKLVDQFGNQTFPTELYKAGVRIGMSLFNADDARDLKADEGLPLYEHEGRWLAEGNAYEISFVPTSTGECELHLFYTLEGVQTGSDMWRRAQALAEMAAFDKSPEKAKTKATAKMVAKAAASAMATAQYGGRRGSLFASKAFNAALEKSERLPFPGSPFTLRIDRNNSDAIKEIGGTAPADYTVERSVFEDAQRTWRHATIDAFSSAATAMCDRFWTHSEVPDAEGFNPLNSLKWRSVWKPGEVVWAHPPVELLLELTEILQHPDRHAETIVCCPLWTSAKWFRELYSISEGDYKKYTAGKLIRVADDAPNRLEEWPIALFHIRARKVTRRLSVDRRPSLTFDRRPSLTLDRRPSISTGQALPSALKEKEKASTSNKKGGEDGPKKASFG
jgi:hypothetical protein